MSADWQSFYFAVNGYFVVETDQDSATSKYYFQYMNSKGQWYIMRQEALTSTTNEYKWVTGDPNTAGGIAAATAWTGRASLTYNFPNAALIALQ